MINWAAIEAWPLAEAVRRSTWAYPLIEIVHLFALATVVGSLLLLELRVFGAQPALPLRSLGRLAVRTALAGFALSLVSGSLLFISDAAQVAANAAFRVKLVLIMLAGANALVFHARDSLRRHDAVARVQAALSLVLWAGVIAAGRLIAYL